MSVSDERLWAMLSYILSIVVGLWAPLVIFLVFKDRSTFVRENSRESLNMHITVLIAVFGSSIILGFGGLVMFAIFFPLGIFAFILWAVIAVGASIAQLIFNILAGMKANDGYVYRIPCILRLVK